MRCASAMQLLPTAWRVRLPLLGFGMVMVAALGFAGTGPASLGILGVCLCLGLAVVDWFIESQITKPLHDIAMVAQQVATGEAGADLGLNRCDDVGVIARALRRSGLNLQSLVADVRDQAEGVQTSSSEIAAATADLASRTEQTASNLQETAAAMEQQTATVRQNAETAQQACAVAQMASQVAAQGGVAVNDVVQTMGRISASSCKIADIIGVIDGIAFQTNILALNAAVEAPQRPDSRDIRCLTGADIGH